MSEFKGVPCRIYPTDTQKETIHQSIGCSRFVWNTLLGMLNERYANNPTLGTLSYGKLCILLTQLKREHPWLCDADSVALQASAKNLSETFNRFFKKTSGYPRFKSRKQPLQSYKSTIRAAKTPSPSIRLNEKQTFLKLPKLGWVKCRVPRSVTTPISSVTVKRLPTGQYEAILLVEDENQVLASTGKQVGIDLGVADLAITSDGDKFATIDYLREHKCALHYWEKRMARRRRQAKATGIPLHEARNYQRAKQQVARIHAKMRNQRRDRLHKLTTDLVKQYDVIAIEDLRTANLVKNRRLARSIASQSWRLFRDMLAYKCATYGKELRIVNPYKTSQVCSSCGFDDGKHPLHIREWTCPMCHACHDRDINAAKNILAIGLGRALVTTA